MSFRVYVDGQEGTTGLRIHEVLASRPDVELLRIDPERRKDPQERARLLNAADVAFLCLPDAGAREAAVLTTNPDTRLIDASTAHRTAPDWVYGLPELAPGQRAAIAASRRIANPGCHATAFVLLVRPLVDAGLLPPGYPLHALSITGYSGGGKSMIAQYEAAAGQGPLNAPRQYGLGLAHKHLPEMQHQGRLSRTPVFSPVVGPFYKGLAVSIGCQLADLAAGTTVERIAAAWQAHYAGEPFIRVMPSNDPAVLQAAFFDPQACNDTNRVDLFVFGRDATPEVPDGQVMLIARLDNLGKGACGAAIQSMNILMGVPEGAGL